jgi:Flp pilus assembly protein TadG
MMTDTQSAEANCERKRLNQLAQKRRAEGRAGAMRRRSRAATVTVEFALTFTILITFFMASLDFGRVNLIRHTINNAAFEAARAGIIPGATAASCRARANAVLATGLVQNATVTVTPATIDDDTETIVVTVTASVADNSWMVSWFFDANAELTRSSTIVRETY